MERKLFDANPKRQDLAFKNIKKAKRPVEKDIKNGLEDLWADYSAYADKGFPEKFAQDPNARFWEMYLSCSLLRGGKTLRKRSHFPKSLQNHGPDIAIDEGGTTVWVEAVVPERGHDYNPDRVVDPMQSAKTGEPRTFSSANREVDLRIVDSVLKTKSDKFRKYMRDGIVSHNDVIVIAANGAKFIEQGGGAGFSRIACAVYPIGEMYATLSAESGEIIDSGYKISKTIERTGRDPEPRDAFLRPDFSHVSGLLWSRMAIENFLHKEQDFVFVHNALASAPLPLSWFNWQEEDVIKDHGDSFELIPM